MYLGGCLLGILTTGVLKSIVTLLTLWLFWKVLRGRRGVPKAKFAALARLEHRATARFLFWGLLAFLTSELTCAVEIYILMVPGEGLRLVHSYMSALGAGLIAYGTFLALDVRLLHYFDQSRGCMFVPLCRGCAHRENRRCKLHPIYLWGLTFSVMMAMALWFIPVKELVADPADIVLPYESLNTLFDQKIVPLLERSVPSWDHQSMYFVIPREMSLADFRHIPTAAATLALAAIGLSFVRKCEKLSFLLACLAAGSLSYSYLEATVYFVIPYVYVGAFGHEVAELVGLATLSSLLHQALSGDLNADQ